MLGDTAENCVLDQDLVSPHERVGSGDETRYYIYRKPLDTEVKLKNSKQFTLVQIPNSHSLGLKTAQKQQKSTWEKIR